MKAEMESYVTTFRSNAVKTKETCKQCRYRKVSSPLTPIRLQSSPIEPEADWRHPRFAAMAEQMSVAIASVCPSCAHFRKPRHRSRPLMILSLLRLLHSLGLKDGGRARRAMDAESRRSAARATLRSVWLANVAASIAGILQLPGRAFGRKHRRLFS
jgi:hypothetical protein